MTQSALDIEKRIDEIGLINRSPVKNYLNPTIIFAQAPSWSVISPPLSLATLVGMARGHGYSALAIDLNLEWLKKCKEEYRSCWEMEKGAWFWASETHVKDFIEQHDDLINSYIDFMISLDPKMIGFSVYASSYQMTMECVKRIKKRAPWIPVILGGPHVSYDMCGPAALVDCGADFIVEGEGEQTLLQILQAMEKGDDLYQIPGIFYFKNLEHIRNKEQPTIRKLDELPYVDFSDFSFFNYDCPNVLPIMSSRGCPNKCIYCTEMEYWRTFRVYSGERVFNEIVYQMRLNPQINFVEFQDSLINGNIAQLKKLATLIIEGNLNIEWKAQAVIRREMDYELFALLKKSGCKSLGFGMETASNEVMIKSGKALARMTDLAQLVKDAHRAGLFCSYNVMFGLPAETEESHIETLNFLKENREWITSVNPSQGLCSFAPSTRGHKEAEKYGMIAGPTGQDYWKSVDGTNTILTRIRRFEEFNALVKELEIHSTNSGTLAHKQKLTADFYFLEKDYENARKHYKLWLAETGNDEDAVQKIIICEKNLRPSTPLNNLRTWISSMFAKVS